MGGMMGGMMDWGTGWSMGFGWFGLLCMVLFWGLIIGGVAWIVSIVVRSRPAVGADAVLDERYARGELTREQYQAMKADLRQTKRRG